MSSIEYPVEKNIFSRTFNAFKKENQGKKRYALVRFRFLNLFLLLAVFILFLAANYFREAGQVFALLKAFSEAALVGALADWFAVTALFKHPLGIPIPHTAIIPRNKNRIARSLARFVKTHFLNEEVIRGKISRSNPARQLSGLLHRKEFRAIVCANIKNIVPEIFTIFQNPEFREFIAGNFSESLKKLDFSGILAILMESFSRNGEHKKWLARAVSSLRKAIEDHEGFFKSKFRESGPWWSFGILDGIIFRKIIKRTFRMIEDFESNPDHEFRKYLNEKTDNFIHQLKNDRALIRKVNDLKDRMFENEELGGFISRFVSDLVGKMKSSLADPESGFMEWVDSALKNGADDLESNLPVQHRINDFVQEITVKTISTNAEKITAIITETMGKWNEKEITEELEVQIGRDLQYIRVNGTLVGGLIGILIYLISSMIK